MSSSTSNTYNTSSIEDSLKELYENIKKIERTGDMDQSVITCMESIWSRIFAIKEHYVYEISEYPCDQSKFDDESYISVLGMIVHDVTTIENVLNDYLKKLEDNVIEYRRMKSIIDLTIKSMIIWKKSIVNKYMNDDKVPYEKLSIIHNNTSLFYRKICNINKSGIHNEFIKGNCENFLLFIDQ